MLAISPTASQTVMTEIAEVLTPLCKQSGHRQDAAQGLRRLGKQGTALRHINPCVRLCLSTTILCRPAVLGMTQLRNQSQVLLRINTKFSTSVKRSDNPCCLDQLHTTGTPSSTCLRCHHLVSAKMNIQNTRSPT